MIKITRQLKSDYCFTYAYNAKTLVRIRGTSPSE